MSNDEPIAFTDADELEGAAVSPGLLDLLRADLEGSNPGAVVRAYDVGLAAERLELAHAWADAVDDDFAA